MIQPNPHQSGLNEYLSFFTTSGARKKGTGFNTFFWVMSSVGIPKKIQQVSKISFLTHVTNGANSAFDCLPFWYLFSQSQVWYPHMTYKKQANISNDDFIWTSIIVMALDIFLCINSLIRSLHLKLSYVHSLQNSRISKIFLGTVYFFGNLWHILNVR